MNTDNWLERTELLLGKEKLDLLRKAHVLVVGLGGVGAYAAEMIVRAGVGRMTIADADAVAPSNINRQLVALHSTVGRQKAEILAERLRDINPEIELTVVSRYIKDEETDLLLDAAKYDYAVDAIDTLSPKLALIRVLWTVRCRWSARWAQGPRPTRRRWRSPTSPRPTTVRWPTCCASGSTKSASAAVSGPSTRPNRCAKGR